MELNSNHSTILNIYIAIQQWHQFQGMNKHVPLILMLEHWS